jgi:hypothetical protein
MFGIKRRVHVLWQVFAKGAYSEHSELIAVYRKKKVAETARDTYERENRLPDRKYEVNAWPLN